MQSNGYLDYVFRRAQSSLSFKDEHGEVIEAELVPDDQPLPYMQGRNKDLMEVHLKSKPRADGSQLTLLTFAQAYGFRNIQNVMRKIKQGKCQYDYVELMACPSGCVNGGGQVKLS